MKNSECLNTTENVQMLAMLPVFNSRRFSKDMLKIIQFLKITEEKKLFTEYFE